MLVCKFSVFDIHDTVSSVHNLDYDNFSQGSSAAEQDACNSYDSELNVQLSFRLLVQISITELWTVLSDSRGK